MNLAVISTLATVALVVAFALIVSVPARLLGRWLQRKGEGLEEGRRPDPAEEPEDPFGSG
jgi:hypothetical protein